MYYQQDEALLHFSKKSCSIWMNSSLAGGSDMAVQWTSRSADCSLLCITMYEVTWKTWCMNARWPIEVIYFCKCLLLQTTLIMLQFFTVVFISEWNKSDVYPSWRWTFWTITFTKWDHFIFFPIKMFFLTINSKSSYTSNIHSFETPDNKAHVDVIFFTHNHLLKLWHKVMGHSM